MSDFRTRILGLAAIGMAMAGVSYGQTLKCDGVQLNGIIAVDRSEGQTELVQDLVNSGGNCTVVGAPSTTGTVILNLNATATSTTNSLFALTDQTGEGDGATTWYLGAVNLTQVKFANVAFPAAFSFHVYNIRANASTNPPNTYISESVTVLYKSIQSVTGSAVANLGAADVGYIQKSLSVTLAFAPFPIVNNYATCIGNPLPFPGPMVTGLQNFGNSTSFQVQIGELVPGAFKVQSAASFGLIAGENGSSPENGGMGVDVGGGQFVLPDANTPTELTVALANIPAAATVYLPYNMTQGGAGTPTTLTLKGFQGPDTTPAAVKGSNVVGFKADSTGAITVTYDVTAAWITSALTFPMPVEVIFDPNTAPAQTKPMTVQVGYSPAAAPLGPAGPASIPTFALPAPPLNGSTIANCQTTLLFPFVTNSSGYETGIAIANTTTDNLGNFFSPTGSNATPTPGTCTLNFYGDAAQPAAATYPPTGTLGAWDAKSGQAPIYAQTLTKLITITDFTGYAIANCNFLDAHGFAFIVDTSGSGTASGPEGYVAVVLPRATTIAAGADAFTVGDGQ